MQKMIVFSGLDGAGKSTQIRLLQAEFQKRGMPVICVWSRGGYTPIFHAAKSLVRRLFGRKILPESGNSERRSQSFANPTIQRIWLAIAILDLFLLYAIWLRWSIFSGKTIICDRYIADTLIDFQLNFPSVQFENWRLWKLLVAWSPKPNISFLLLIPVEESVRRSNVKGEPFRDSQEILTSRLAAYQKCASGEYWQVLDGLQPIGELSWLICKKALDG